MAIGVMVARMTLNHPVQVRPLDGRLMTYKNKEDQLASQRRWYARHKKQEVERTQLRRERIRRWFVEYKSTLKCCDCNEDDPVCLDFHHTDPTTKVSTVCMMSVQGYSIDTILKEIAKCIVVCANCHRKRHRDTIDEGDYHSL